MVWILLLSDMDLSTHALTPVIELMRIRSLSRLDRRRSLASYQSLYLTLVIHKAAPKCISGSTSYLQV